MEEVKRRQVQTWLKAQDHKLNLVGLILATTVGRPTLTYGRMRPRVSARLEKLTLLREEVNSDGLVHREIECWVATRPATTVSSRADSMSARAVEQALPSMLGKVVQGVGRCTHARRIRHTRLKERGHNRYIIRLGFVAELRQE